VVKEGEIYTVKNLNLCLKCKCLDIDVGIKPIHSITECSCGHLSNPNGVFWLAHDLFHPLDDLYNEELNEELSEIFTKQPFEI
jgi:hypothetical protein